MILISRLPTKNKTPFIIIIIIYFLGPGITH